LHRSTTRRILRSQHYFQHLRCRRARAQLSPYTTLFRSYGRALAEVFAGFDETPLAAASIAQVHLARLPGGAEEPREVHLRDGGGDRKSTRLNSSHVAISYAVFCSRRKS